jgi:hypothetical protein
MSGFAFMINTQRSPPGAANANVRQVELALARSQPRSSLTWGRWRTAKPGELGPPRFLWRDAYGAISRAARLDVVGYSMPPDEITIRAILRAGVERGPISTRSSSATRRQRSTPRYLDRNVESDYRGIGAVQD